MEVEKEKTEYRFDDRRSLDFGPPDGFTERRISLRREGDRFRAWLKETFARHFYLALSPEETTPIMLPVLTRIKTGEFG